MSSYAKIPNSLEEWAGSRHLSLTLLFTDIVQSTLIGLKLGDRNWIENLFTHFDHARGLAITYDSYVVKVIGDSLMIAFRTSTQAVDYALDLARFTGVDYIGIRVGIHTGQVQIRENDIYGLNVNLASRVQQGLEYEGILVTKSVKENYERGLGSALGLNFTQRDIPLKNFDEEIVYLVRQVDLIRAIRSQRAARAALLKTSRG